MSPGDDLGHLLRKRRSLVAVEPGGDYRGPDVSFSGIPAKMCVFMSYFSLCWRGKVGFFMVLRRNVRGCLTGLICVFLPESLTLKHGKTSIKEEMSGLWQAWPDS